MIRLSPDGTVGEANILDARTDDEAKAMAATLSNGHGIDLWERARYLASFPPHSALYPGRVAMTIQRPAPALQVRNR